MNSTSGRNWKAIFSFSGNTNMVGAERMSGAEQTLRARLYALLVSEDEGTQLVELALVAPIFMLLLTGIASFAMALYSYQQLGYATSAAAQQIGAQQGLLPTGDPCGQLVTDLTTSLSNWTPGSFTYTEVITDKDGTPHTFGPTTGSSFTCTPGAADMAQNEPMTVKVSYTYTWFTIFTWGSTNTFKPSGNLTVTEAVMVE
jgi:Flp pilus assembly protein TadG